ncbi:hypothetical protein CUR178_06884 [Leishmania enriettii]|uniref:Uncharacterized protein n=1 Tax=Leishmania enriettii TaxID=5663 RepID=A0A836HD03_LEIEN|nr:hypothetical protein CUR178_06884 [Leishmania enriettii]
MREGQKGLKSAMSAIHSVPQDTPHDRGGDLSDGHRLGYERSRGGERGECRGGAGDGRKHECRDLENCAVSVAK